MFLQTTFKWRSKQPTVSITTLSRKILPRVKLQPECSTSRNNPQLLLATTQVPLATTQLFRATTTLLMISLEMIPAFLRSPHNSRYKIKLPNPTHFLNHPTHPLNHSTHPLNHPTHPLNHPTHPLNQPTHPLNHPTHPLNHSNHLPGHPNHLPDHPNHLPDHPNHHIWRLLHLKTLTQKLPSRVIKKLLQPNHFCLHASSKKWILI